MIYYVIFFVRKIYGGKMRIYQLNQIRVRACRSMPRLR